MLTGCHTTDFVPLGNVKILQITEGIDDGIVTSLEELPSSFTHSLDITLSLTI